VLRMASVPVLLVRSAKEGVAAAAVGASATAVDASLVAG
jgi:hypothetical protein